MHQDDDTILDQFTRVIPMASTEDGEARRSYQIAGSGARFLAGLLDFCIQGAAFVLMAWLAYRARPDLFPRVSWIWAIPTAFIEWHVIYMMLFESFTGGATPGKRLMNLRVISTVGAKPGTKSLILRNLGRLIDLALGGYLGAFISINMDGLRRRVGDRIAATTVVYSLPLAGQLAKAEVPESIYSTSEDGYLLQAWVEREKRLDAESQLASAIDLAAYLHSKYDSNQDNLPDPATYLHQLYEAECEAHHKM